MRTPVARHRYPIATNYDLIKGAHRPTIHHDKSVSEPCALPLTQRGRRLLKTVSDRGSRQLPDPVLVARRIYYPERSLVAV